jgi:hypothetical protein
MRVRDSLTSPLLHHALPRLKAKEGSRGHTLAARCCTAVHRARLTPACLRAGYEWLHTIGMCGYMRSCIVWFVIFKKAFVCRLVWARLTAAVQRRPGQGGGRVRALGSDAGHQGKTSGRGGAGGEGGEGVVWEWASGGAGERVSGCERAQPLNRMRRAPRSRSPIRSCSHARTRASLPAVSAHHVCLGAFNSFGGLSFGRSSAGCNRPPPPHAEPPTPP